MIVMKKALPRRTFLRGMGVSLALPLLDAMVPSMTALANTPASPSQLKRLGFVYMPMGCDVTRWTPSGGDRLDELSPTLEPLASVKENVTIISNLELKNAYPGTHATSNASFLSAAKAKRTESTDYYLGTTVDQIAARHLGRDTQLPSLELSMDLLSVVGQCDNGYACVYQNNLSWSSPTSPLPAEAHPRVVFESLFGEGRDATERRERLRERASLLDSVSEELTRLKNTLGPGDGQRLDEYLHSVRDVEQRIQRAEAASKENPSHDTDRPAGVPTAYADHARLMFDLQLLAKQVIERIRRLEFRTRIILSLITATILKRSPRWQELIAFISRCSPNTCRSFKRLTKEMARCSTMCSICTVAAWVTLTSMIIRICQSSSPVALRVRCVEVAIFDSASRRHSPICTLLYSIRLEFAWRGLPIAMGESTNYSSRSQFSSRAQSSYESNEP
jgi:hypothetical protein